MDQGFAPRPFATPAAFVHLPAPSLLSQNIRNRKCSKTHGKFNCGGQLIGSLGSSTLSPQPRLLPGKPLLTYRNFFPFPSPSQAFLLLEWPRKIKADHFVYWGPLMNSFCWGLNELPHDPLLSAPHYHQEAQVRAASGIRYNARGTQVFSSLGLGAPLKQYLVWKWIINFTYQAQTIVTGPYMIN